MSARGLAGLLFLLAGLTYFGLALPTRARATAAQDEFSRVRAERQRLHTRRSDLERRQAAVDRAARMLIAESSPEADAVNRLRLFVVGALKGRALSDVRLGVGAGRPPVAATVRLSAAGAFGEIMRLCAPLVGPGSGIVLERVRLGGHSSGVALELEGLRLASRP